MKKFLWSSFIILSFLIVISFSFFYRIWAAEKSVENLMLEKAKEKIPMLVNVEQTKYFSGDKSYYFIVGKDIVGDQLIVWINQEEEIGYRYLTKFLTEAQITELVRSTEKDVTVKRITPGIIDKNKLIYEVLVEGKNNRLGYIYYDLQTGEFIKKYRLGLTS